VAAAEAAVTLPQAAVQQETVVTAAMV